MLAETAMEWMADAKFLPPTSRHEVIRLAACDRRQSHDDLAEEVPVALEYNGIAHAVMLATPCDLEEFALGFSLTEGILESKRELYDIAIRYSAAGITVSMTVSSGAFMALKVKRRNLVGRTGCGLCGTEQLDQVLRPLPTMAKGSRIQATAIRHAMDRLAAHQPIARLTGATHAAAWCSSQGQILAVFEDVGRHNALDKLAGAMAMTDMNPECGFALITSRASVEMIQKAATARIPALIAISAPTALAVRAAQQCGLTLVAFARREKFVAYANANYIESD